MADENIENMWGRPDGMPAIESTHDDNNSPPHIYNPNHGNQLASVEPATAGRLTVGKIEFSKPEKYDAKAFRKLIKAHRKQGGVVAESSTSEKKVAGEVSDIAKPSNPASGEVKGKSKNPKKLPTVEVVYAEKEEAAQKAVLADKKPAKGDMILDFRLSPKQQDALNSPAKFLLYGGAKGGGKSWFMCVWIFLQAIKHRGNKLFFCRRRSVDFTNTTLETWKKSIPANLYRVYEQKKKIVIPASGSVIDFGGLDDPLLIQSLNSAEYAHIGIDQAEEIEQDSFSMLRGTLRHRLADGKCPPYQIRLTANPAQCWLKDYFILNPEQDTAYIQALPTDNPGLPKDYVENLRQAFKHRPHLLEAYLHGSWDDLSGNDTCIRGSWIEESKKKKPSNNVVKRVIVNDPAITGDENVCFLMEKAGEVYYKADELIIEHKRPLETAALLSAYRKRTNAQIIAVDCIGIGQGVIDGLNQLEEPILSLNSCAKPTSQNNAVKYANLRAQIWWEASEKFADSKVALPSDDFELAKQLGIVRFDPTGTGKLLVQDKAEIKKNLGRSPDRADAFVMGLYALDYVERLDHVAYQHSSQDRAGYGELVPMNTEEQFVNAGDDYSGYNI